MIPGYKIEYWLTAKQNKYMNQCDLIATMTVNTICCMLYKYELNDIDDKIMENVVNQCIESIKKYDLYKSSSEMRHFIEEILNKNFKRKV